MDQFCLQNGKNGHIWAILENGIWNDFSSFGGIKSPSSIQSKQESCQVVLEIFCRQSWLLIKSEFQPRNSGRTSKVIWFFSDKNSWIILMASLLSWQISIISVYKSKGSRYSCRILMGILIGILFGIRIGNSDWNSDWNFDWHSDSNSVWNTYWNSDRNFDWNTY